MTIDHVSRKTAVMLRENGFDELCYAFYMDDEHDVKFSEHWCRNHALNQNFKEHEFYTAPSLFSAKIWIEHKYGLYIEIRCEWVKGKAIFDKDVVHGYRYIVTTLRRPSFVKEEYLLSDEIYDSEYKAVDAAIQYALTL